MNEGHRTGPAQSRGCWSADAEPLTDAVSRVRYVDSLNQHMARWRGYNLESREWPQTRSCGLRWDGSTVPSFQERTATPVSRAGQSRAVARRGPLVSSPHVAWSNQRRQARDCFSAQSSHWRDAWSAKSPLERAAPACCICAIAECTTGMMPEAQGRGITHVGSRHKPTLTLVWSDHQMLCDRTLRRQRAGEKRKTPPFTNTDDPPTL